jgi:yecA family protein
LDTVLSRFGSEYAMNNLEEIDGFFAALICSPDVTKPSEYLPEIWGGEMADDEAFADRQELQDFLSLLLDIGTALSAYSRRRMYLLLCCSKMKKARLTLMIGHADSCVAFA